MALSDPIAMVDVGAAPRLALPLQLHSLQALRGIAAMMVVLYHTGTIYAVHTGQVFLNNIFRAGFTGVDVFFVLSGVVIFWAHDQDIGRPGQATRFILKRAFRLLPVYWVVMSLKVLKDPTAVSMATVFAAFFLMPTPAPFINVAWTLSYEILFYTLFLLLIILPRGLWTVLPMVVMAVLALLPAPEFSASSSLRHLSHFLFNAHLLEFVFGVVLSWALRRYGAPQMPVAVALATAGFVGFAVAAGTGTTLSLSQWADGGMSAYEVAELRSNAVFDRSVLHFGFPAALLIAGLVAMEMRGRLSLPFRRQLVWVGDISYSLYLTHGFVIHLLLSRGDFGGLAARYPLVLVPVWLAAVAFAWLSYRLVEVPAMGLGRRLLSSRGKLSVPKNSSVSAD